MTDPGGRTDYTQRMHRVLDYVDRNLDRTVELAEAAQVAHFSRFHFHRVFSAWLGETFGEYLRRRRVEVAASRLLAQPRVPVTSIALSVGFGSAEAFGRAFRVRFGCTPTAWRKGQHSNPDQVLSKADRAAADAPAQHDVFVKGTETVMKVSVIEWPAVKVAYLRHVGPYGEPLSRFWQEEAYPWMVSNGLLGLPRYGVSLDDPGVTRPGQCRYDAAVAIKGPLAAPGKAALTTLPGGRYAVAPFRGTSGQIGAAWDRLLRDGCPRVACSWMGDRSWSITPRTRPSTRRPGCSRASLGCRSRRYRNEADSAYARSGPESAGTLPHVRLGARPGGLQQGRRNRHVRGDLGGPGCDGHPAR